MNRVLERSVVAGLVVVFLVLIINAFLSNRAANIVSKDERLVSQTYAVKAQLETVLSTMTDAETGTRGFMITGLETYLEPYHRAIGEIAQDLTDLSELTADNPRHQRQIELLRDKIREKLEILKTSVAVRRSAGFEGSQIALLTGRGKQAMDEIRKIIAEMMQDENDLLTSRGHEARTSAAAARLTFRVATAVALALVAMMGWLLIRGLAERRRNEAALENQQEWLETTLSSIGDAVIATDHKGQVRFMNQVAETLTGWRQSEAVGLEMPEVFKIVNEQTRQPVENPVTKVIREGQVVGLANHTVLIAKNGTERAIDDSGAPIKDTKGKIIGAVLVFRDVSARRQADADKERLSALRNLLLESTSEGIYGLDLEGNCTFINQAAARMFGYSQEEMLGRNLHALVHYRRADGSFYPDSECPIYQTSRDGMPHQLEDELMWRRDGGSFYASCSAGPLIEHGVVKGAVVTITDLTERRRSAEALNLSKERLNLVLESVNLGMWFLDLPSREFEWSDTCKEHYWLPPETEVTFDTFLNSLHPDDRKRTQRALDRAIEEHAIYDLTHRTVSPEGKQKWIRAIGRGFYDSSGKPSRFNGVTVDVTGQKRIEESLREAGRLKDEFLATVSHELRTPLNAIIGWVNLLRGNELDRGGVARAIETIERNATAQARLIEDLLDVSRIISGKLRLEKQMVDPVKVIELAIEAVSPAAESRNITLIPNLDRQAGPVSGDPQRLQQVVWNLLSNAVKFTPKGGRVEIDLGRQESQVQIKVTDTGQGISPDFLPFVFDRFRQAEGSTSRQHGGLGLGLAIVKHLVEAHGGMIKAESQGLDQGSSFIVNFPVPVLQAETRPEIDAVASEDEDFTLLDQTPSLDGLRVLVIDDEADARDLLAVVLQKRGARVVVADSAATGIEKLNEQEFDVLISDIQMPGADGFEFIRRVREREAGRSSYLPAIALTAHARAKDRMQVLAAGFQMHVSKPVSAAELVLVVASLAGIPGGNSAR